MEFNQVKDEEIAFGESLNNADLDHQTYKGKQGDESELTQSSGIRSDPFKFKDMLEKIDSTSQDSIILDPYTEEQIEEEIISLSDMNDLATPSEAENPALSTESESPIRHNTVFLKFFISIYYMNIKHLHSKYFKLFIFKTH